MEIGEDLLNSIADDSHDNLRCEHCQAPIDNVPIDNVQIGHVSVLGFADRILRIQPKQSLQCRPGDMGASSGAHSGGLATSSPLPPVSLMTPAQEIAHAVSEYHEGPPSLREYTLCVFLFGANGPLHLQSFMMHLACCGCINSK